ncbi:MAG: hypothetical protein ACRCZ2_13055, partial [Fusobacteriaceae bacterium]
MRVEEYVKMFKVLAVPKTKQKLFGSMEVGDILEVSFFASGVRVINKNKENSCRWILTANFNDRIEELEKQGFEYV